MDQPKVVSASEVFAVFCGNIDQEATRRLLSSLTTAMSHKITHVHLLFQSTGGTVGDGVCLYNFFRTLPIDLTLYNVGGVHSIAVIAYLGAKKRKTSARATFSVHRSTVTPQFAAAAALESVTQGLVLDDQRTESILRQHISLTEEQWSSLDTHTLFFSGEEAVKIGMADEIGEFSPPKGSQVYSF